MPELFLGDVADSLLAYNSLDLVASVGALQLMPENADHTIRLEALAHVTASLPSNPDGPMISSPRLRRTFSSPPFSDGWLVQMEDPNENAFTEAFTFHGGSYIVFPGNAEDPTFILKNLARAIFLFSEPFPDNTFVEEVKDLIVLVLSLSNEIARRIGIGRGIDPVKKPGTNIIIPDSQRWGHLKRAVTFTLAECAELVHDWHIDPRILADLCTHQGDVDAKAYQMDSGPFYAHPLVMDGHTILVAMPGMLLSALINAILRIASVHGVTDKLTERFTDAMWQCIVETLGYIDNTLVNGAPFNRAITPCMRQGLFSLDADKVLYALLITDSLESFDYNDMYAPMPIEHVLASIEAQLAEAREILLGQDAPANAVLFLVIFQSYGRLVDLTMNASSFRDIDTALLLSMTAGELVTLTLLEGGHQLALWKFARARTRVREQAKVLSLGTLNEYYYFRGRDYSYYWSDKERFHLFAMPPGGAGELRREVIRQRDWHAVPAHSAENRVIEVTTFHSSRDIPMYVSLQEPQAQVAFWVEAGSIPIWVVGPRYADNAQRELHGKYVVFAQAIAYWLWQFSPSLSPALQSLASNHTFIRVQLNLLPEKDWQQMPPHEQVAPTLETVAQPDIATCIVTIHPALGVLCGSYDNHGERVMMREVLRGLRSLLPSEHLETLSDAACENMLNRHAPLGAKKMLLFQTSQETPELMPTNIPAWRKVQAADVHEVLDELGEHLRNTKDFSIGPIADEQRVSVLRNHVVPFCYERLQNLVASLNPNGLLESLVAYNEAIVRETALNERNFATRLACYGSDPEMLKSIVEEVPERGLAATSLRFLIEYTSAQPPHGQLPMSLSVFDRMMALASRIINFGFDCDLIYYNLADLKYAILPSGRFGTARAEFDQRSASYMTDFMSAHIASSIRDFDKHARESSNSDMEQPDLMMPLDVAAQEEFGLTITDIVLLLITIVDLSSKAGDGVSRLPLSEFVRQISDQLNWSEEKMTNALDLLLSRPREDYLQPPAPYGLFETYPWRFNRAMSYIRRPLLYRMNDGVEEVIWGPRHVFIASHFLVNLCIGGRLPMSHTRTKRMQQVMGRIHALQGEKFNNSVADLFDQKEGWIVKRRVKKIGKLKIPQGMSGDFDVLAVNPMQRRIMVLECKDLAHARTPYEMATETQNLIRATEGKRSAVDQAQEQTQWLRENLQAVLEWLVVDQGGKWKIEPYVIVDHVTRAPYLQAPPIPILPLSSLREQLEKHSIQPKGVKKNSRS